MQKKPEENLLSWIPLLAGALASYGPLSYNYGFALYFLDWRYGFVKRGLIGQIFSGIPYLSHTSLLWIEMLFLAAAFAATYFVLRQILFGTWQERMLSALLLSAPATLPHLGYLFAQPDVTLYLLTILSLYCLLKLPSVEASLVTIPITLLAMLAHEAYCLMFYPLLVLIFWIRCRKGELPWALACFHIITVGAGFLAILHYGHLKVSPTVLLMNAQRRTDIGIQQQVYDVVASGFTQQAHLVRHLYSSYVLWILFVTVLLSLPYWYLLATLCRRTMRAAGMKKADLALAGALFVLSPLLLCGFGHDTTRWIAASCTDVTLLALYLYLSDSPDGPVRHAMQHWATPQHVLPWMAYCLLVGPYGATGIRAAENLSVLWAH